MALPKLTEDLAFISKLGDYPGSDNNLTTDQFREQFDAAALLIQKFLNDELIPGLDQIVDVEALLNGVVDNTLTQGGKAADAKVVGERLAQLLMKTGGTMTGALDMGGNSVTNLPEPANEADAVRKSYVDKKHAEFQITVPAASWSGSGPFTQMVAVNGILSTDKPHWDVVLSSDSATAKLELEAFSVISDLDTNNGSVFLTCYDEKPGMDLVIQMEVNR